MERATDFIIVSGLSGAGKSVALRTLEDIGFYCIDNLPLFLLRELALGSQSNGLGPSAEYVGTAAGIDARNQPDHLADLPRLIGELSQRGIGCRVVFLDADSETLMKRFSETRRKHPLTSDEQSLEEAIALERRLLEPLSKVATTHIDTTHTNVHELRDLIRERLTSSRASRASVLLQSFGFKNGVPEGVDFVFDVRCLPNPHWQPELRPQTGRDAPVAAFLEKSPEVAMMRTDLTEFLDRWIPRFETDGRSYLTIAVGCTGGQHRSVYMVEAMRQHLAAHGHRVLVRHRDLP
ncbi:MAG: RNase adapter RapZ [Thiohalocapsa sp.]